MHHTHLKIRKSLLLGRELELPRLTTTSHTHKHTQASNVYLEARHVVWQCGACGDIPVRVQQRQLARVEPAFHESSLSISHTAHLVDPVRESESNITFRLPSMNCF